MPSNAETIRALWDAFEHGGVDAVLAATEPDTEWVPATAGGRVLRGHDELREFFDGLRAAGVELRARMDALEEIGDTVLVRGSLRVERWGALSESTMVWAYRMHEGRVRHARSFHSRAEALSTLAAAAA